MTPISAPPRGVSILARIAPALSYGLPALGAAISALMLINVFRAMRNAEAAGGEQFPPASQKQTSQQ